MPDYTAFTVEDFVFDPAFQRWIRESLPEDNEFWQAWLAQHPDRADDLQMARQLVLALETARPQVEPPLVRQDVQRMLNRVSQESPGARFRIHRPLRRWAAAAAVALLAGLGWWLTVQRDAVAPLARTNTRSASPDAQWLTRQNNTSNPVEIRLPDGSTVTLSPRSQLKYPAAFPDTSREVSLTGEAFFSIVRNPARPFRVYADEIVTQVLGTSFRVRAYEDDAHLTVAVRTGKVAVYARGDFSRKDGKAVDKRVISLTPNQQAEFSRVRSEFRKSLVAQPIVINKKMKSADFEFDDTPVVEIFQRLRAAYGIDIRYDAERIRDCRLTASLSEESMMQQVHIVCRGIGATYEVVDGGIVVHSDGCK